MRGLAFELLNTSGHQDQKDACGTTGVDCG
jgi:hypothetical protein